MTTKTNVRLILLDQEVAAPPEVDPDGVRQCDDVARVLIWLHSQINILIDRQYSALPEMSAYSMMLMLNTLPKKDKTVPPEQKYWAEGVHEQLYDFYEALKLIAIDPVREARRSQAEDDPNLRRMTAEKIKRLRQIANMKQPRTPEGLVRLRFHLDSSDNPEVAIVFAKPEEFSHAADLLAAKEEEETLTLNGKVSEVDEASGILMVRTKKNLTFIQAPESLRKRVKPGTNSGFLVREKANTTKVNVYVLLDIIDDESDE